MSDVSPPADPLIGARVGEYHIQGVLGRGGMGVVYQAEDTALGIPVALKSITAGMTTDAAFVRRFRTEARAMARVASPHIVRVMALRETEHGLFIVMEYVDGGSLHDRMANGPMPWETLWPLLRQMLLGLEAAHTVGVVHRDIKPRNVLLTTDDTVKLTDFGLARLSDTDATRTQAVAGTLAYMSPEQVRSLPTLDHRSDLFSLGLTAYEALVGRLPFDRDGGDFTMMRAIVEDAFPPPTSFSERVTGGVAAALMKSLEKDPAARYQSAAEMREALAAAGDDPTPTLTRVPRLPVVAPPPTPSDDGDPEAPPSSPARQGLPVPIGLLALVALALLGLGAGGWWLTRPGALALVPAEGVRYFLDGEPVEGTLELDAGTHQVRCLANDISATAEVEVTRNATRRVACLPHDQAVDVSASWNGSAEPAAVMVDGAEGMALPARLSLSTGRHTLRIVSQRIDSVVTVDVPPTFDPEPPPPQALAIRAGSAPAEPLAGGTEVGPVTQQQGGGDVPPVQPTRPPPQMGPQTPGPTGPAAPQVGFVDASLAPGVTLSIDGSGISSNGSRELRPGTYTARCQAGPLSESTRITVSPGQRTPVACYAPARVVRVSVTSTDAERPWMSVVVDGQAQGQTPTQVTLPVGRHTVIVRRRGYEVVGEDMVTVDVPPRFSSDPLPPVPLTFQVRAAQSGY
ncbi:serine/threonine-protein kinase [Rubrivirga marina]|uniref:Protein kinase domain-containing protein n=1 Tax=Rubrivirga marina TaxID=1196024 RepID=A0A271IWX6_9BACT|nr:serine/threonine-protein kinase [Rubrivirga marina]PAP75741.1 hypothetical protein BSZ37_04450 [Rubrivirga marina]